MQKFVLNKFWCKIRAGGVRRLSVTLVLCLLVGVNTVGTPTPLKVSAVDTTEYVLKSANNSTTYSPIGQWLSLDPSKTYVLSYCGTDLSKIRGRIRYNGDGVSNNTGVAMTVGNGKCTKTYDPVYRDAQNFFTVPSTAADDPDNAGNKLMYVGIEFTDTSATRYIYNLSVYEKGDSDKTNLYKDAGFTGGGTGILTGKSNGGWHSAVTENNFSSAFTKVTLASIGGIEMFKRTDTEKMVLKCSAGTAAYKTIGQWLSFDPSKTYVLSYYCNDGFGGTRNMCYYNATNAQGVAISLNVSKLTYDSAYKKVNCEFTIPAAAGDDPNVTGNKLMYVGIDLRNTTVTRYFYNLTVYEKDDVSEANMYLDAGFFNKTGGTIYQDTTNGTRGKGWNTSDSKNLTANVFATATLESIGGMTAFQTSDNDAEKYVLKSASGSFAYMPFGQWLSLDPSKTYVLSYYCNDISNTRGRIRHAGTAGAGDVLTPVKITYDSVYKRVDFEFTVPGEAAEDVNAAGNKQMFVGLEVADTSVTRYFYNLTVYEKDDEGKTNLYSDAGFLSGGTSLQIGKNNGGWYTTNWNEGIYNNAFSKVTLASLNGGATSGGIEYFKIRYSVTFNANAGTPAPEALTLEYPNFKVTEPATMEKEGFIFAGWYSDAQFENKWNFEDDVTENLVLYAQWIDPYELLESLRSYLLKEEGDYTDVEKIYGENPGIIEFLTLIQEY